MHLFILSDKYSTYLYFQIPITVLDWATNILPFLVETSKELTESARLEFEKVGDRISA